MEAKEPTFWLLNGQVGWRTGTAGNVRADARSGLVLAPDPRGPLALWSADNGLGGLALPRGFALDGAGGLYLLGLRDGRVRRFRPHLGRFETLPLSAGAPRAGSKARQLQGPRNLAIAGGNLYLADTGNRRVQVFDCASLALRHVWRPEPVFTISDPLALALRLRAGQDSPLIGFLRRMLSAGLRQAIDSDGRDPERLGERLSAELGQLVRSRELYGPAWGDEPALGAELRRAIEQAPEGEERVYLNQRLLAALFPEAISVDEWEPYDVAARGASAYVLDRRFGRVYVYTGARDEPRLLIDEPAAAGRWGRILLDRDGRLYLYDGDLQRLEIYDRRGRREGESWAPPGPAPQDSDRPEEVWDEPSPAPQLFRRGDQVYILDRNGGRVFRYSHARAQGTLNIQLPWRAIVRPTTISLYRPEELHVTLDLAVEQLEALVDRPGAAGQWRRLAVDGAGRIYLHNAARGSVEVFSPENRLLGESRSFDDVRDRFDPPPLLLDRLGRFCLPAGVRDPRLHGRPEPPQAPDDPLAACVAERACFDRDGELVTLDPAEPRRAAVYQREGVWISEALDSGVHRCQWHRVELEALERPANTRVVLSTYSDDRRLSEAEIAALPSEHWRGSFVMGAKPEGAEPPPAFLVQSREGRYLWVRLALSGDGYGTPAVGALRVHYPRESYLGYLPAVYGADDEGRWFLERFLSIVQDEWSAIERRVAESGAYFDPRAVSGDADGGFMRYLAAWLDVSLEGAQTERQRRTLLLAAARLGERRGTWTTLRRQLQACLQSLADVSPPAQEPLPQIVEGFRERRYQILGRERGTGLGAAPAWSRSRVGRLQLNVFAREGEARLASAGDPEGDLFHEHAHRFRVFVPAAWVHTASDERTLRRAIDGEKPAHTGYDLHLVEPRLRLGMQSLLGVDTLVGDYPLARLGGGDSSNDAPPSLEPRSRLGYDTVLARGAGGSPVLRLRPGLRLGVDTCLS